MIAMTTPVWDEFSCMHDFLRYTPLGQLGSAKEPYPAYRTSNISSPVALFVVLTTMLMGILTFS